MRDCRIRIFIAAALLCEALTSGVANSAPAVSQQRDGSLKIAGRKLTCGSVRSVLDRRLPNLGISIPAERLLVINPALLEQQPETVRLFVFSHECGHHHVGGSELEADCWAVGQGVHEGWLKKAGLAQVCRSFANAPQTLTHPSAVRRCGNLDRCFAAAEREITGTVVANAVGGIGLAAAGAAPKLLAEPRLVRIGIRRTN